MSFHEINLTTTRHLVTLYNCGKERDSFQVPFWNENTRIVKESGNLSIEKLQYKKKNREYEEKDDESH
jgi:hypothetical protein